MIKNLLYITRIKIFGAKILYKTVTLFVGKNKRIVERKGIKFEIDLSEGIELSMYLFRRYQKHIIYNNFYNFKPDDIIFDIGTNIGLMTLQFAKQVPLGKVYSFEPTHYAIGRLKSNLLLNQQLSERVQIVNTFISEKTLNNPDIIAFSSWKVNGESNKNNHPIHLGTPKSTDGVNSVTLDDYIQLNNINKLDFIKIDTDGHEFEIFKGGKESIKKLRPVIIFEIGKYILEEKKYTFDFFLNFFYELDYKIYSIKINKEITFSNYNKHIPKNNTADLIAIPN